MVFSLLILFMSYSKMMSKNQSLLVKIFMMTLWSGFLGLAMSQSAIEFLATELSVETSTTQNLVAFGDTWKYLDDGTDQGTAWRMTYFDDSAWKNGMAELGYGDGDERTVVNFGDDAETKFITTYFRHTFYVTNPLDFDRLDLHLLSDDGAVVYLNGIEVYRFNMADGEVNHNSLAQSTIGNEAEVIPIETDLTSVFLLPGINVLAVEVHQVLPSSSDLSFDLELLGHVSNVSTDISFAVIGDFGFSGVAEARVAQLVSSWRPDFIITTGGNNYPEGQSETFEQNILQYYGDYVQSGAPSFEVEFIQNRFFPALGDRDWAALHCADRQCFGPWFEHFYLPGNERYYDFIWGPVHFFAIDSDPNEPDGRSSDSIQGQWLQRKLAASTSLWKIVYMHHPPIASDVDIDPLGITDEPSIRETDAILQWPFQQWGATTVLAGHNHVYERIILDDFPYFVNGAGGHPTLYLFDFPPSPQFPNRVQYNDRHGAMLIDASETKLLFLFIADTGEIIDTYLITAP